MTKKQTKGEKLELLDVTTRLGDTATLLHGSTMEELATNILAISNAIDSILNDSAFKKRVILNLIVDALPPHPKKSGKLMGIRDLEKTLDVLADLKTYLLKDEQ